MFEPWWLLVFVTLTGLGTAHGDTIALTLTPTSTVLAVDETWALPRRSAARELTQASPHHTDTPNAVA
jgi:hypothetical protein